MELQSLLGRRLCKLDLDLVAKWASESNRHRELLFSFAFADNNKPASNALWCLTHLRGACSEWLQSKQDFLIDAVLIEKKTSRKRMLLQLLRNLEYSRKDLRGDFLDFCLTKINAECEPYAVRCFSLYIAAKMCRHYSELMEELKECISMLSRAPMSPGLRCAVRNVDAEIRHHTQTFLPDLQK